jgi:hypothetical protein
LQLSPWRQFLPPQSAVPTRLVAAEFSEDSLQFGSSAARRSYHPLAIKFAAARGFGQSDAGTINLSDTMSRLNRRSLLAAGMALLAKPVPGAAPADSDVDVVIVGAAARRDGDD